MSSTETKKYSPIKAPYETEKIGEAEFSFRAKEFQKCIDDVVYFASNYYYIRSIDLGTILLPPYEAQCDLLRQIHSNRKVISLASRQSGKTTAYIAICLWICFFMEGKEIVILANKEKTAIGILKRIKRAYEWIPKEKSWIKPGVTIWNDKQIEFDNGCSITAMATSSDAARSGSAYLCITGTNTVNVKLNGKLHKNLSVSDLFDIVTKEKDACPCNYMSNLTPAIDFCNSAVDI